MTAGDTVPPVAVDEYARIAAAEDEHWWYRGTRAVMRDLLKPWLAENQTILDAGCGPGGNGAWLARHGAVVALDLAPEGLRFVQERRPALDPVRASVATLPFPDQTTGGSISIDGQRTPGAARPTHLAGGAFNVMRHPGGLRARLVVT